LAHFETDSTAEATGSPVQVLIVQDHALLAAELSRVLAKEADFVVVGVSSTGADALKATREHQPDVVPDGLQTARHERTVGRHPDPG